MSRPGRSGGPRTYPSYPSIPLHPSPLRAIPLPASPRESRLNSLWITPCVRSYIHTRKRMQWLKPHCVPPSGHIQQVPPRLHTRSLLPLIGPSCLRFLPAHPNRSLASSPVQMVQIGQIDPAIGRGVCRTHPHPISVAVPFSHPPR